MTNTYQRLFVLDANVFITAHRRHYGFDICPGFWECLIYFCCEHRLLSIDRVRDELVGSGDALSNWARDAPSDLFISSMEKPVSDAYREVMRWVYANDQFLPQAKDEFSRGANGRLVAYVRANDAILVTLETYSQYVRRRVPLPNVCRQFRVTYIDTFEMLRRLGASFAWEAPT